MTTHKFSTSEGIEITIEILECGLVPSEGEYVTDFRVTAEVPGHMIDDVSTWPNRAEMEIRTHRCRDYYD